MRKVYAKASGRTVLVGSTGAMLALMAGGPAAAQTVSAVPENGEDPQRDGASAGGMLAEVTVTASRIERSGFTAPSPTTTLSIAELQQTGATDIGGFLNKMPSFSPGLTPAATGATSIEAGANFLDLRGLGRERTLVLMNSRRHVPTTGTGAVDLNVIPMAAVKNIEIVTGGASAAWGSDAVAGVVNILYDADLQGVRGDGQYGSSQQGDAEDYRFSIAAGDHIFDGRGHILLAGEFQKNHGVTRQADRAWGRKGWHRIANPLDTGPNDGQPAVLVRSNVNLWLATEGGRIMGPDPIAGYEFGSGGTLVPTDFGSLVSPPYTVGGSGANFDDNIPLSVPFERRNLLGTFDYDIRDDVRFFIEASYGESEAHNPNQVPHFSLFLPISADNAFIPDELRTILQNEGIGGFAIGRLSTDIGYVHPTRAFSTRRAVFGFDGKVFDDWSWQVYYQHGRTTLLNQQHHNRIEANFGMAVDAVRDADGNIVCRATRDLASLPAGLQAAAAACVPIDLFGVGAPSAEAVDYITGTSSLDQKVSQEVYSAQLSGDLVKLWAGPLSVAVGTEYREERLDAIADPISQSNGFLLSNPKSLSGGYDVREFFGELALPLLSDVPLAQSLELNAAARRTDYSTVGQVTTSKLGLVWSPGKDLLLRSTVSRDIRAPNISELFATRQLSFFSPTDPCDQSEQLADSNAAANCQAAGLPANFQSSASLVPTVTGGNTQLQEEQADVTTFGLVLSPRFIPGLRASFDWFDIEIDDAINTLSPATMLNLCYRATSFPSSACSAISRDGSGQLSEVSQAFLNIASVRTRGLDLEIDYRFDLGAGTLQLRLLGSYIHEKSFTPDGVTRIDLVGTLDPETRIGVAGGMPEWRGNASIGYTLGSFGVHSQVRYVGPGKINPEFTAEDIDRNDVAAEYYLDLSARYGLDIGGTSVELFGGVNNVFNNDPPVLPEDFVGALSTNTSFYDVIGRYCYAGARMRF